MFESSGLRVGQAVSVKVGENQRIVCIVGGPKSGIREIGWYRGFILSAGEEPRLPRGQQARCGACMKMTPTKNCEECRGDEFIDFLVGDIVYV